jgi:hypothetical protein
VAMGTERTMSRLEALFDAGVPAESA